MSSINNFIRLRPRVPVEREAVLDPGVREAAAKLVAQADEARDAGDWVGAAEFYAAALAVVPDDGGIHVQCGHMNKEIGRYDQAEAHYREAERRMPEDGDLALQFGHFYNVTGQLEAAVAAYTQAAKLLRNRPDVVADLEAARKARDSTPAERARARVKGLIDRSFDTNRYLEANPDLRDSGMDPMEHFLQYGWKEGRPSDEVVSEAEITDAVWRDGLAGA